MKILLLGEYSRLHNTLKEALELLGHQVLLVGDGDLFKDFPSDISIASHLQNNSIGLAFGKSFHKVSGIDIFQWERQWRLNKLLPQLKNFDVVQIINQDPFRLPPDFEIKMYEKLFAQNGKCFLLACGEDSHVVDFYEKKQIKYSVLTPVHLGKISRKELFFAYKYLEKPYKNLYNYLKKNVQGIIPTDLDYAIPYQNHPKNLGMIPNPVNIDKITYQPMEIKDKINIFFGLNRMSYYKKGADIILSVLKKIEKKYRDKVHIQILENAPYDYYIQAYNNAHIFIDQLYAYDQGYNALEAMAKGKCVITGAEKEFYKFYNLQKEVAVNGLPDEDSLFYTLENLINRPNRVMEIGNNAREFIEQHHDYKKIAKKYLSVWQQT